MSLSGLEKQVLSLSLQERAKLAQRLLESLDELNGGDAEQLRLEVAACRAREIDQGKADLVTAEDIEARVQALLG